MHLPQLGELIAAIELVGSDIANRFAQPQVVVSKDDGTPVTPVDIEANRQLGNYAKLWGLGFLGEEGNGEENTSYYLFVDPLDGTGAYARGMATATVIASIMEEGLPIMAVIHNPVTQQTWAATKGGGAWYSYKRATLTRTYVAASPSKRWSTAICIWPGADARVIDFQQRVLESTDFSDQQMGAIGLGGGLIASGTLHATAYGATSAVETAAMSLIVREAGGYAIDLRGDMIDRFELGQHRGKTDFLLPHGAIIACNSEVGEALADLY
jgi:fructose-1,6-bisphosphatase/inositol monophosphatase family enzyme